MRPTRLSLALLALLAAAALTVRLARISGSMPYPGHIDEEEISNRALRILSTGDWNPHYFEYPSLPIYLAVGGFAAGFLHGCSKGKLRDVSQIGSVGFPHYDQPVVVYPARALYAVLSVLTVVFAGLLAHRLSGSDSSTWLAAAVLAVSPHYLRLSWKYLNVDVVGAFFVVATLLHVAGKREGYGPPARSLAAGALAGLAIGSKYALFPILAPPLVAIVVEASERRLIHLAALFAGAIGAFAATTPYAIGDLPAFLNGVGGAAFHYAHGHPGFEGEPGVAQLHYYSTRLLHEFGGLAAPLAIVGAAEIVAAGPGRALAFLSFPAAHIAYMSAQRVHFFRHVTGETVCLAILVACGLVRATRAAGAAFGTAPSLAGRPAARAAVAAAVVGAFFVAALPLGALVAAYDLTPDSRNLAVRWLKHHLPDGERIIVPDELGLRLGALRRKFRVTVVDLRTLAPGALAAEHGAYLLLPTYDVDYRTRRRAAAARANRAVAGIAVRVVAEFGEAPVLIGYAEPLPDGNPSIRIARIEEGAAPGVSSPDAARR